MHIDNQFEVAAPPDRVYAFLLDVNRVVTCMPGAELAEVVDPTTFKGRVKIKVGPITVSYNGTARIVERDEAGRAATLQAEGRETTGPGSARATARMTVENAEAGSLVRLATDLTVAGRIANFGRGVMEDVSKRLVSQMADCIKATLEAVAVEPAVGAAPAAGAAAEPGAAPAGTGPAVAAPAAPAAARPVNALSLFFAVLWDRIRRLFRRR
ncbi:MAG TPA: SRPBCC family protein [Candidatus Dormibacteraeota bacterium]|nr:SRPBCC family protein [Candidatus Dormibacteraeota bacterium]